MAKKFARDIAYQIHETCGHGDWDFRDESESEAEDEVRKIADDTYAFDIRFDVCEGGEDPEIDDLVEYEAEYEIVVRRKQPQS